MPQRPREAQKEPERPKEAQGSSDEPREAHMYVEAERRQNKPVEGLQSALVAESQKVASVISNSRIGKKEQRKLKKSQRKTTGKLKEGY